MRKLKLYIETSTWNFVFADDAPEKRDITIQFFSAVENGSYDVFISQVVLEEINDAPEPRRSQLFDLIRKIKPVDLDLTPDVLELTELYMQRNIVPLKKRDDAFHVAVASVHEMNAVITWNYSHLANLRKSELFNAVNLERGYTKKIEIVTPMEVSNYED
jgi:predicted nucleic acid-binding protein